MKPEENDRERAGGMIFMPFSEEALKPEVQECWITESKDWLNFADISALFKMQPSGWPLEPGKLCSFNKFGSGLIEH